MLLANTIQNAYHAADGTLTQLLAHVGLAQYATIILWIIILFVLWKVGRKVLAIASTIISLALALFFMSTDYYTVWTQIIEKFVSYLTSFIN